MSSPNRFFPIVRRLVMMAYKAHYSKACGINLYKIPLVIDPIFVFGKNQDYVSCRSRYIEDCKARHIRFYDLAGIFFLVDDIILIDDIALHIGALIFLKGMP